MVMESKVGESSQYIVRQKIAMKVTGRSPLPTTALPLGVGFSYTTSAADAAKLLYEGLNESGLAALALG